MKTKFLTDDVQRRVCFTFDIEQARYLFFNCSYQKMEKITDIPGVVDLEYDGHFGPHIWISIDSEHYDESLPKVQTFLKKLLRNAR